MVKPIPEGYGTVTANIVFADSRKAIEFYKKAFGAQELSALAMPDGRGIMHAEIRIGGTILMMTDEKLLQSCKSAQTLGGSPVSFYVYVEDADAAFRRAVAAGASPLMPVQDMFWGDRLGHVRDPFGHDWNLATHKRDVAPDELRQGAQTFAPAARSPGSSAGSGKSLDPRGRIP